MLLLLFVLYRASSLVPALIDVLAVVLAWFRLDPYIRTIHATPAGFFVSRETCRILFFKFPCFVLDFCLCCHIIAVFSSELVFVSFTYAIYSVYLSAPCFNPDNGRQ